MKRILALILMAVVLLGTFAGCASGSGNPSAPGSGTSQAPGGSSDEDKELVLWHFYTGNMANALADYRDRFKEIHPDITVTPTMIPFSDFKKMLSISTAADSLPDLVLIDNCDTVMYSAMGLFADLTDAFADNEDLDDYFDGIIACCMYNERLYALPAFTNNIAFYYNKDHYAEMGIEEVPTNWEELRDVALRLTNDSHYGLAFCAVGDEEGTFNYLPFQLMAGGNYYDLDSDAGLKALTFLTNLVEDGSLPKDTISWSQDDVANQFASGNASMLYLGCWQVNEYTQDYPELNFGTFSISDGGRYGSVFGGENLAVIDGPNKEEAILFAKFFMDFDQNKEFNIISSHFPARHATLEDQDYKDNPNWEAFIQLIPHTTARPASEKWPEVSLGYQRALQLALSGQATPEEAVKEGQAIIDAAR